MQKIVRDYKARLKEQKLTASAGYFPASDKEAVKKAILDKYIELTKKAEEEEEKLSRVERGQWHTAITPALEEKLVRNGIDIQKLRKLDGFQMFEYGYVWSHVNGTQPQLSKRLLINDGALEILCKALAELQPKRIKEPKIRQALLTVIDAQANENLPDEIKQKFKDGKLSVSDLFRKSQGLTFRSPLLKQTISEVKEDTALTYDQYFEVLNRRDLLVDARRDRQRQYKAVVNDKDFGGRRVTLYEAVGDPRPFQRSFALPGAGDDLLWYWIDYDKEWP
jgi:hypothetical protein